MIDDSSANETQDTASDDSSFTNTREKTDTDSSRRIGAGTIILMLVFFGVIVAMCIGSVLIFVIVGLR